MINLPNGITLIAAVGNQGQIGLDNSLPWPHDKEDMKWFQQATKAADVCIAGFRTYESLPAKVRTDSERYIVIDRPEYTPHDFIGVIDEFNAIKHTKIVVIGGAKTYARWMPVSRTVLITKINYNGPADTWMPELWSQKQG